MKWLRFAIIAFCLHSYFAHAADDKESTRSRFQNPIRSTAKCMGYPLTFAGAYCTASGLADIIVQPSIMPEFYQRGHRKLMLGMALGFLGILLLDQSKKK